MCSDTARLLDLEPTNEIRLYGYLGAAFGRHHAFVIHTARQALNALVTLKPGFAQALSCSQKQAVRYAVFVGKDNLSLTDLDRPTGGLPVRIVPVIAGSKADGVWQTIGGVALFSAGAVSLFWGNPYAYYMMGLGASLALGGVAQLISPHLPATSHSDLQAENVVGEGGPVPLLYGRLRVGSTVISAGRVATDVKRSESVAHEEPLERKGPKPDSLLSKTEIELVDLICEGPIAGCVDREHPWHSVYFDGVPMENAKGERNFPVSNADFLSGTADQKPIDWLNTVSCETAVGIELHPDQSWTLDIDEPDVDEVAITLQVHGLYRKDEKEGEQPSRIECWLYVQAYGISHQVEPTLHAFDGVCRGQYERTIQVDLSGLRAKRYRLTLRRTNKREKDHFGTVHVMSYARRRNGRLRYPMSALAAFRVNSERMQRVPLRTYDMKGLLVKVPTNYDPDSREYSGEWDGTFKQAWTDNPAWVFYDLLISARYGAGNWVDASSVDRYSLYAIARYCDERVPNGRGGQEPRFTCNCYITSRTHAFALLQQLASVFRGMAYWSGDTVVSVADKPQDPSHVYVPANVIDGEFRYMGSSLKTRYTVAMVSWHDPNNAYQACVESVEDAEGVERYGMNTVEVSAFGCTSRGQAQRVGYWYLLTSRLERDTVVFSVGLDSVRTQPGQVIAICDPARSHQSKGGRIRHVESTTRIVLDRVLDASAPETLKSTLKVTMPDGSVQTRGVTHTEGNIVELEQPLPTRPVEGAVWIQLPTDAERQLFRVVSVSESEDGMSMTITATEHDPEKFKRVDRAAMIDFAPEPPKLVGPVQNLVAQGRPGWNVLPPSIEVHWDRLAGTDEYELICQALGSGERIQNTVREPHLRIWKLSPGRYSVTVIARLADLRRSERAETQVVLHGDVYPTALHASRNGRDGPFVLKCEAGGDRDRLTGAEYAVSASGFKTARHFLQGDLSPFVLNRWQKDQQAFAWVRMRYGCGFESQYSEWYPPETGEGVPVSG